MGLTRCYKTEVFFTFIFQHKPSSGWLSDVAVNQPLNEKCSLVERG